MMQKTRRSMRDTDIVYPDFPFSYSNWTKRHECLSFNTWHKFSAFVSALRTIECINFSSLEMRREAREILNKIPIEQKLFTKDKRFPEGLYICGNFGVWAEYILQLDTYYIRSLEYEDKSENDRTVLWSLVQAEQDYKSFSNCITKINHAVFTADGIWDQQDFESYFQLRWDNHIVLQY